ncbi:MAG: hypothetical protein R2873_24050 [Caldilineaceae bacterium]
MLRGLLALLLLLVLMQFGDLLALARMHDVRRRSAETVSAPGTPLPLLGLQTIYRLRTGLPASAAEATAQLSAQLRRPPDAQVTIPALEDDDGDDDGDTVAEERWLRLDHLPFLYLRLLLAAAVTAGLILLWVMLAFGWEADPPLLDAGHDLSVGERSSASLTR